MQLETYWQISRLLEHFVSFLVGSDYSKRLSPKRGTALALIRHAHLCIKLESENNEFTAYFGKGSSTLISIVMNTHKASVIEID
jgi:hypothetical protein